MLSEEETENIKQKIVSQIENTFPTEQMDFAKQQVESMNSEQLEAFLQRNKMIKEEVDSTNTNSDCVFCSIVSDKIKSVKLEENEDAVAILEINPISKGHTIIIPKEHADSASKEVLKLAKIVSAKLKKKLKPKSVEVSKSKLFGHEIINLLPVYKDENFNSERKRAKIEELEKLKEELEKETKKERKPRTKKIKEFFWLPKRIP